MSETKKYRCFRYLIYTLAALGVLSLTVVFVLLRLSVVTDHLYSALVKDPERHAPPGQVLVAPADGTVLYVRRVRDGVIPEIVKRGVAVPVDYHLRVQPQRQVRDGYLIGIYMNTHGVHINRAPLAGELVQQTVYNGPHMDMTRAESRIILAQLIPGWVSLKKFLGFAPYNIEDDADFILKSARETLAIRDVRGQYVYVTRIADYYVGRILTWVREGQSLSTGDKLGMITWGSQTDVLIEASPTLQITVDVGDHVYAGESVLATY